MKASNEESRRKSRSTSDKVHVSISERRYIFVCCMAVIFVMSMSVFSSPLLASDIIASRFTAGANEAGSVGHTESQDNGAQGPSPAPAGTDAPSVMHIPDNYVEQAITKIRAGTPRTALELAEKGVAANPDSAIALAVLGLSQLHCCRWPEAEAWLKQAIALDSALPEAHLGLAEIALGRMHYDLAVAHAYMATNSEYFKGTAYSIQAQCLQEKNLHEQAAQAMQEAYKWSGHLPEYHRKNIQNWSAIFFSYEDRNLCEITDEFRSTVIPFVNYEGHALLPMTVNGQDLDSFLLDTGFGGSLMISPEDAENLGLVFSGEIITRTFYGELVIKIGLVDSLRLGDLVVDNVPAYVCDIPGGFEGLIGWQLLKHLNFSIDFIDSRITMFNPKYPNLQKDVVSRERYVDRIPFLYDKGNRIVACFGGKGPQYFIFDSGATYPGLHVDASNDTIVVGPESRTSIRIGHLVFDNMKVLYSDFSNLHERGRYYFDGIVGISIFQNSILHFNPGESVLYVECGLTK